MSCKPLLLLFAVAFAVAPLHAQDAAPPGPPAYKSDPKFQKAIAEAHDPKRNLADRLSRWQQANKVAGNACIECMRAMLDIQMEFQQWKDMATTATQMQAAAVSPVDRFYADSELGTALMHSGDDKPAPAQLQQADTAFQAALAIAPHSTLVLYQEGRVLAKLGRDDDARELFKRYVAAAKPDDIYRTRAERFVGNPQLSAMPMAPAFTIRTTDGQEMTLDNMVGKVVLLDFWASWCGPCRETLPEIKRIVEKFAGEPLIVVSISIDRNADDWEKAMKDEGMTWPQYRDATGKLAHLYNAMAIPLFFTIDSDGVLQKEKVGSDTGIESNLKKLIAKARDAQKRQLDGIDQLTGQ